MNYMDEQPNTMNTGEILLYQNQHGSIKIDVRLEEETVWLTQPRLLCFLVKEEVQLQSILQMFLKRENLTKKWYVGISD